MAHKFKLEIGYILVAHENEGNYTTIPTSHSFLEN